MAKPSLDFWFDFASTYSYPAAMRIASLAETSGITVRWRPFMLGPIFKTQGWATSPFNLYPAKGRNMWRDLERVCAALDLPFTRPDPFPQNSLLAARAALVALADNWGETCCRAIYRANAACHAVSAKLDGVGRTGPAASKRRCLSACDLVP